MDSDFQPLPDHPDVHVDASEVCGDDGAREIAVHFRGPAEALIAAGAATAEMLHPEFRDVARADGDGDEYCARRLWYQPMSGTARYWRWYISRFKPLERALRLPGASAAWDRYVQRRQAEETFRHEELTRRPVQRLITENTWKHGNRSARITRAEALEIAVSYLARQLRACLQLYEAWLPEKPPSSRGEFEHTLALPDLPVEFATVGPSRAGAPEVAPDDAPYDELAFRRLVRKRPTTPQVISPIEPEPKGQPVWKVWVPHDFGRTGMVGSSRMIRIDAETGEILSDWEEGE